MRTVTAPVHRNSRLRSAFAVAGLALGTVGVALAGGPAAANGSSGSLNAGAGALSGRAGASGQTPLTLAPGSVNAGAGRGITPPTVSPDVARVSTVEQIERFSIDAEIDPSGDLRSTEEIVWNFGNAIGKHGIFRYIPTVHPWTRDRKPGWKSWEKFDRITAVRWGAVTSPTGAPTATDISTENGQSVLRIGDADLTVGGRQTYRISYVIDRAVVDGELRLSLTGTGWVVPIQAIDLTLRGSAARSASDAHCELNGVRTDLCAITVDGSVLRVQTNALGVEVVVPVDPSINPAPVFEAHQTLRRAFDWSSGQLPIVGVVSAAAVAVVTRIGRRGRDLVYAGGGPFAGPEGGERARGRGERLASPVEFAPPDDIRPGLIPAVRSGKVPPVAISATLLDLAVKGHVRIEVEPGDKPIDNDYTIVRLHPADEKPLLAYEEAFLNAIFLGSDTKRLSEIRTSKVTGPSLSGVKKAMIVETVTQGWWKSRPDHARWKTAGTGVAVTVIGFFLLVVLAAATKYGLVALPVIAAGLGILAVSRSAPVRTAKGTTLAARLNGFELLFSAGEGERLAVLDRRGIVTDYLPYAVVYNQVKPWIKRFAGIDGVSADGSSAAFDVPWYRYPGIGLSPTAFTDSLSSFNTSLENSMAASSRAASASSSSSGGGGFSSGGGGSSSGGGGGGSW